VSKDDINVFELQVLQTLKSTFDDVLPGKSTGVVSLTSVGTKEDLGGDDVVSSIPSRLLKDSTHLLLGLSSIVGFGSLSGQLRFQYEHCTDIEHVDTSIPSSVHQLLDDIALVIVSDG